MNIFLTYEILIVKNNLCHEHFHCPKLKEDNEKDLLPLQYRITIILY
jgi:hypothetical protein